jgi:RNA polymerase sigma-70 factor (ECF subfamily)
MSLKETSVLQTRISVEALIREQLPWIRWRLRTIFPAHLDLDELEQQVLLNLQRSLPTYRGEGSLRAWVNCVTVRVGFKYARRTRLRRVRELELSELDTPCQSSAAEDYFTRIEVLDLLSVLPPEQERVVVLCHMLGLGVREVAAHQGLPVNTVRSRLRLGMQKLRRRARARDEAVTWLDCPARAQLGRPA